MNGAEILTGIEREHAIGVITARHYTGSVPSGKSHYIGYEDAIVVWSIPANKNIANFILGWQGNVWELSRLWAPDGHRPNLLTEAISRAVRIISKIERPDAVVSYADPNAGHSGGIYRAASWIHHGQSEESRVYVDGQGKMVARRAFHSGKRGLTKKQIEAMGYKELKLPGKIRFVKFMSPAAKRAFNSKKAKS